MFLILFVLHDTSKLEGIMRAWTETGVRGVTILLSTGYRKFTEGNILREDLPLIFSIEDILQHEECTNRTLFSVVKDEEAVDRVIKATENLVGDLNLPNTGILTVLPVSRAYGLDRIYD
ncbi:MAG TPA: hypothetical protein DDW19_04810 [Anaerolineaceae bacterium]|jgi:hypothetical protein|nr:hypothetical protein [Anaerolineaceae bacterium]